MTRNQSKFASACLLLLLPVFAAAAQAPGAASATSSAKAGTDDSRRAAIKALNDKQRAALDAIRADKTLTPDQRREKISATLKDFRTQRENLLGITGPGATDPRHAAIRALHEKQRTALDAIRDDKTLTPEQRREKISATLKDFRTQQEALMKSQSSHP